MIAAQGLFEVVTRDLPPSLVTTTSSNLFAFRWNEVR